MFKKIILLLTLILTGLGFAQDVSADSLEHMLERAKVYYNNGEYEYAIRELEMALQYLKQYEQSDQVEAYKYLAFSYVAFGDKDKAKQQFKMALALNPDLELDPATVSPKIIKVFEEAKAELEMITPPQERPAPTKPAEPETDKKISTSGALMRSCCVPGWGQFYKGHDSKGKKIMIASGLALGSTIISVIVRDKAHNDYLAVDPGAPQQEFDDAYDKYKFWHSATVVSGVLFGIVYVYNIYDAVFSAPAELSSIIDPDQGFYCDLGTDQIELGYRTKF